MTKVKIDIYINFDFRLSVIYCKVIGHLITNYYITIGQAAGEVIAVDLNSGGTLFEYPLAGDTGNPDQRFRGSAQSIRRISIE